MGSGGALSARGGAAPAGLRSAPGSWPRPPPSAARPAGREPLHSGDTPPPASRPSPQARLCPHLPQALRLPGVLGLHQLQLFLPENPRNVRRASCRSPRRVSGPRPTPLTPTRPPRPSLPGSARAAPAAVGAPPEHLQSHQLGPKVPLRALLSQLVRSVIEELRVGLVRAGFAAPGAGDDLGGGDGGPGGGHWGREMRRART